MYYVFVHVGMKAMVAVLSKHYWYVAVYASATDIGIASSIMHVAPPCFHSDQHLLPFLKFSTSRMMYLHVY